jgi:tRNA(Ile)-lysidine synthetase-like protein
VSISSAPEIISPDVASAVSAYLMAERDAGVVVVGISGGRDSVALAAALADSIPAQRLHFGHVHHHLRGADADADADLVVRLGVDLGVATHVVHVDVPGYRARQHLSVLAAARFLRYQALGRLVADVGADALVLAHTLDDRLETMVLHALRGTGVRGLVGMHGRTVLPRHAFGVDAVAQDAAQWTSLQVHRPLLSVRRTATGAFCRERGLEFHDDPSNSNMHYRRVWVRQRLLPALRSASSHAESALAVLAVGAAETEAALDEALSRHWEDLVECSAAGVAVSLAALSRLPRAWRPYVLARSFRDANPSTEGLQRVHVLALERLAAGNGPSKRKNLPGGMIAVREGGKLTFRSQATRVPEAPSGVPFALQLTIPGSVELPDGRLVRSTIAEPPPRFRDNEEVAWIDAWVAGDSLLVRNRRPGDRYRPLGAAGSKRLKDLFIDKKISRCERDRLPVLVANGEVVWVAGLRVAEQARVRSQATSAVRVELVPAHGKNENQAGV